MKEFYISQLKIEQELTDFFMVKSIAVKLGANKKQYLDITLGDGTGDISGKKWDVADAELAMLSEIKEGDIVKIKASVTEWNGLRQLRVNKIRKSVESDMTDIKDYIKAAPEKPEDMYDYIYDVAKNMDDQDLKALCTKVLEDNQEKFMYYPAASKNHHAEFGGLLYHMKRMLMTGLRVCEVYTNLNQDLVAAGVILHDMEKLNEIMSDTMGISSGYSFEGQMLGHIVMGVSALDRMTMELDFPREKAIMLEHMILSHHYEPEFGSPKRPLFPEAELLHYLDILDARMFDMEDALKATEPGDFSEKVWTLDNRRLYKPQED
ncbi:MAG TPA: OB-fold nucleic acid binding domain-containing protein [Anaerovoracaceae bacterium]|nr:OB-fold nucleic acid binding domain-containing protein [Anaerovoracaceae bacterium]